MALRNEEALPESSRPQQPVQVVTENGFSIVRLCELDPSAQDTADQCRFVVEDPSGRKRQVTVEFTANARAVIQQERQNPLSVHSSYWLECAEHKLAMFLWQNDSCPPGGRLILNEPSCDDVVLGSRWID